MTGKSGRRGRGREVVERGKACAGEGEGRKVLTVEVK